MSVINNNELIFYQKDGVIMSGGYSLKSQLLKHGISPMQTLNTLEQTQNSNNGKQKVSDIFSNLAVPVGLFLLNKTKDFTLDLDLDLNLNREKEKEDARLYASNKNMDKTMKSAHNVLSDDIYDKLFKMVQLDDTKKTKYTKTRRHIKAAKSGKQTKKRKE
jgi:hypothetical protein